MRSSALEGSEEREARSRSVDHRDRHRPVQRDDGPGRDLLQDLVEREDLRPVGRLRRRRFVVHRGDRGLELVRADGGRPERSRDQREALIDLRPVPQLAPLLRERHERPVLVGARGAPGIGQQHQREEARHLAVGRHRADGAAV